MIINTFGNARNVDIKTVFQAPIYMILKKIIGVAIGSKDILYKEYELCIDTKSSQEFQ